MSKISTLFLTAAAAAAVVGGVIVPASAHAAEQTLRFGTAKTPFVDDSGATWSADSGFVGGYQVTADEFVDIKGTTNDALYQSERWGMTGWRAPVSNGTYDVTLKFAETFFTYRNARVFSVTAEGRQVVKDLDIYATAGPDTRLDKTFRVTVGDGSLDLGFSATKNNAKVDAILVKKVSGGGVVTPTPRPVTPTPAVPTTPPPAVPTTPPPAVPTTPPAVPTTPPPTAPSVSTGNASGHAWKSGSSGVGAADGRFGTWRGSNLDIVASWAGNADNSANFYTLWNGAEYGAWNGSMDMAVGGIDAGETWSQAASGRYDARWRQSLTKLKSLWGNRQGTMYIRFAHEMNGYWFSWNVNRNNYQDFMTSWKRYRALQQEIFPQAQLVFSVNKESNGADMDWTKFFPGKQYVDVLSVDYYNNWPYASTLSQFQQQSWEKDGFGAPKGINAHLAFARSQGLPLAVSEWSGNADDGDSPAYVQGMFDFFKTNAGNGAGQLAYEVQFNVDIDGHRWLLGDGTRMSNSSATYRDLF